MKFYGLIKFLEYMAIRSITTLKGWFRRGKYPTEGEFGDLIDSMRHRSEAIPLEDVMGLTEALNKKFDRSEGRTLESECTKMTERIKAIGTELKTTSDKVDELRQSLKQGAGIALYAPEDIDEIEESGFYFVGSDDDKTPYVVSRMRNTQNQVTFVTQYRLSSAGAIEFRTRKFGHSVAPEFSGWGEWEEFGVSESCAIPTINEEEIDSVEGSDLYKVEGTGASNKYFLFNTLYQRLSSKPGTVPGLARQIQYRFCGGEIEVRSRNQNSSEWGDWEAFGGAEVTDFLMSVTYAQLKAMRDSSLLVPGMRYRITDFVTTVANDDEARSAGHPFDVVVLALSGNTLAEEAMAMPHDGDTYFENCNLTAWKVWYCLDNDADRFQWADTVNGKGVIFRLIDEWNNDCPYDFKNVQFKRYLLYETDNSQGLALYGFYAFPNMERIKYHSGRNIWAYTFSTYICETGEDRPAQVTVKDCSLPTTEPVYGVGMTHCADNRVGIYTGVEHVDSWGRNIQVLNNIVCYDGPAPAQGANEANNVQVNGIKIGSGCYNITVGGIDNVIAPNCRNIIILSCAKGNVIETGCAEIIIEEGCTNNRIGYESDAYLLYNSCNNMVGCRSVTVISGNDNVIGSSTNCSISGSSNSIGCNCTECTIDGRYNSIGDRCSKITLTDTSDCSIGFLCENCTFENSQGSRIGNRGYSIVIKDYSNNNVIGNRSSNITIRDDSCSNKVGDNCTEVYILHGSNSNRIGNYCKGVYLNQYITHSEVDDNCNYIDVKGYANNVKVGKCCGWLIIPKGESTEKMIQNLIVVGGTSANGTYFTPSLPTASEHTFITMFNGGGNIVCRALYEILNL